MKGRSIWTYPKLNNNMDNEKVEVKYVGGAGRLSPTTGRLSSFPLTSTKFSLLLSILSLVIAISFFCLVLAWLWGVPEKIVIQNQEVERLEHLIEEQQNSLDEIMSSKNRAKSSMDSLDQNKMMSSRNKETWKIQFQPASSCILLPAPGPCTTSSLQRWHYHAPSQRCRQFTYGGCQGNENNFMTARQCEEMCGGVKQPLGLDHVGPRFRGISSGKNSGDEVPTKDLWRKRCLLPPTAGPCRGQLNRFYWDENSSSCSTFSYGGCAGNTNNFISNQECLNSCQKEFENPAKTQDVSPSFPRLMAPDKPEPVSQCLQEAETGNCRSSLVRWYFHSNSSACRMFTWGGCGGNSNNFLTEAKCEARCSNGTKEAVTQDEENVNHQEEEDGDIMEVEDEEVMEEEDEEVLEEAEESRDEMCSKPADVGDCKGLLSRFFYNLESETCEEFTYGGCGGNRNNFLTEESCNRNCVHL